MAVVRTRAEALGLVFLAGAAFGGCAVDAVITRASNEFRCPRERVQVIDREDIAEGVYDVDACGARARYMCIETEASYVPEQCVHEADPARWDPDPVVVASLPRPAGMTGDPRVAHLCVRDGPDDCLRMDDGTWRWYHRPSKPPGGGLGMTNQ